MLEVIADAGGYCRCRGLSQISGFIADAEDYYHHQGLLQMQRIIRDIGLLKSLELSTKIPADLVMMTDSELSHLFQ